MYEACFGLKRRPFAATPDATCFLSSAPIQAALDELVICVEQGQGIGILTAPPGTGKTLLCERLRFELGDRFETVFLRHASFLTRRALLQTILCELNLTYNQPSEQELRLELLPAIRALAPTREALVLICDEAHQLSDSLLEELRILADFAESGRPLVRLVLVGQLSLEEKLTQPSLAAFNQRIRAQINLSTFDHEGSLDYIDYRLTWAGGRTHEIFTPAALGLIVQASDGVPRCINQLADHTLLLAFVAEQKPAGAELVREALADLRQLPLQWNDPLPSRPLNEQFDPTFEQLESTDLAYQQERDVSGYLNGSTASSAMYSYEPAAPADIESFEPMSGEFDAAESPMFPQLPAISEGSPSILINRIEVGSDDWRQTIDLFNPRTSEPATDSAESNGSTDSTADSNAASTTMAQGHAFHELVRDAYIAAGTMSNLPQETKTREIIGFIESTSRGEDPFTPMIDEPHVDQFQAADTQTIESESDSMVPMNLASNPNKFQEEVVVDRYAAIDAGFAPPTVSPMDTADACEVHGCGSVFSDIIHDATTDPQESREPAGLGAISQLSGAASDYATHEVLDVTPPATIGSSDVDNVWTSIHGEGSVSWKGAVTQAVSASNSNPPISDDSIEHVADEVFSLGWSLQPSGVLSSNSESILTALRREMVDLAAIKGPGKSEHNALTEDNEAWQSIETTPVDPPSESRPFRYLFSILRRKQRGLA